MKALRAKTYYIFKALKSAQKSQNNLNLHSAKQRQKEEKRIDYLIKHVLDDLGHGVKTRHKMNKKVFRKESIQIS